MLAFVLLFDYELLCALDECVRLEDAHSHALGSWARGHARLGLGPARQRRTRLPEQVSIRAQCPHSLFLNADLGSLYFLWRELFLVTLIPLNAKCADRPALAPMPCQIPMRRRALCAHVIARPVGPSISSITQCPLIANVLIAYFLHVIVEVLLDCGLHDLGHATLVLPNLLI